MERRKNEPEIKIPEIVQLKSGAWHTRVLVDGRRISITKPSYNECLAEYMAVKNGIIAAKSGNQQKSMTLETAVRNHIDKKRGYLSPSTIAGYEKFQRNLFQPLMSRNIYTITDNQWQEAIRNERKSGKSPKYIKNGWMFFAACLKSAGAKRPEVMLYPPEYNERASLTPDEIDIFVGAVYGQPVEVPALLCLSSLRRSEMLALTWDNVDLENGVMYIRGAIVRGSDGLVEKKQNKTDKSRRAVPIIPPLAEALKKITPKTGNVVTMTGDYALTNVKRICESAKITVVDLHGLRHSFASLAYHLGIPEMIAAEIGGWNDLSTMHRIYTHLAQKDIAARSRDFCNYFSAAERKKRQIGNTIGNGK